MISEKLYKVIDYLTTKDIEVTFKQDKEHGLVLDLNTQAKSWLYIKEDSNLRVLRCYTRYGEKDNIYMEQRVDGIVYDLASLVKDCMCGRDYVGSGWNDLMVECGIRKKIVETTIRYE